MLLPLQSFFGVKKGPADPSGGSADGTPVPVTHLSRGRSMDISSQGAGTSAQAASLPEVDLKRKRELVRLTDAGWAPLKKHPDMHDTYLDHIACIRSDP